MSCQNIVDQEDLVLHLIKFPTYTVLAEALRERKRTADNPSFI